MVVYAPCGAHCPAQSLSARPTVEPFAGFVRVDGVQQDHLPTAHTISGAWDELEGQLAEVAEWQDERDAIEAEATQYEVGDMERLRKVAKGA